MLNITKNVCMNLYFSRAFAPEKITDHYREANRGAAKTIFDALVSVPNKGQTATQPVHCIVLSWI